jgi:hypothetical protein
MPRQTTNIPNTLPDVPQWAKVIKAAKGYCQCVSALAIEKPQIASVVLAPCGQHYARCTKDIDDDTQSFTVQTDEHGNLVALCSRCQPGWQAAQNKQAAAVAKHRAEQMPGLFDV